VRDRVARVRNNLPAEVDEPVVAKVEADAQPVIYLAFSSDRHNALEVTDIADRIAKPLLQNLDGVAEIRIFGARKYAMRLWLDPVRIAGFGLTPADVEAALRRQNVELPSGRIESRDREFNVVAETDMRTEEEFARLVIAQRQGYLVRLSDIGRVELGPEEERVIARFRGQPAVALGVIKQSTANPLTVSRAVNAALPDLPRRLPEGMRAELAYDSAVFIDKAISNVFTVIGEAVLLVLLVIFLFLRSLRATLIPLVTIPVSLIGAFAIMAALGFTINTLTLLAMVLAVGLVVDDAIVMLENISRYVEAGMKPFDAAIKGANEIGFAVVAMTFTLAAVYIPVALQTGRTGRLFVEFALTLAATVIVSGFVALTLSPMMCSKLLKANAHHGAAYRFGERVLDGLTRGYRASLRAALHARTLVLALGLLAGFSSWTFLQVLRTELSPTEDRGFVISIAIAPEGSTLDYTARYLERLEAAVASKPEVSRYFAVAGFPVVSQAIMFAGLVPWEERTVKQQQVVASLFGPYFANPGVLAFPVNPPSFGQRATERPINMVLQTTGSYAELQAALDAMLAEARRFPGMLNLDTDLRLNKPQLRVLVDRDKVQSLGISEEQIARTLETMLGGRKVTQFKRDGKQYEVIVQVDKPDRATPSDLRGIFVRANDGTLVQLSNVVRIGETVAPRELNHFNKLRSASITATPAPGFTQGDGLAFLVEAANRVLPPGVQYDFDGQSREFRATSQGLIVTFVLALFFIYLVLAAQFESFIHPFTIMLSVPLAVAGALLALWATGQTLNVYSQIGLVTLIGLITKNGILIVEFANQLREQGRGVMAAVEEASALRLRPILMTTLATILGAVPLATAIGAGAESRQAIGWVIVGGMSFGTLFTLYVVPVVYTLLAGGRRVAEPVGQVAPAE